MNTFVGCVIGMMVGSIVLIWTVVQQPHTHSVWPEVKSVEGVK